MFGCWLYRTHKEAQTSLAPDVTHSAYQDDTYRVGPLKQLEASWQPLLNAITAMGGQVNLIKSVVWIPGGDQGMVHVYKSTYPTYDLPFAIDGLEMLGSVLQERNKTYIGNMEKKISKVAERLKKATDDASLILKLGESAIDFSAHTSYILLSKSLREALSYDASIMPPGAAMTLFVKHDELVRRLLAAIVSTPIEAIAKIRYQLPGPLDGLGMRTTTLRSPPTYLANYVINGPVAEIIARKMGKELIKPQTVKDNIAKCRDQLATLGIQVQSRYVVTYDATVKAMLVTSPWMIGHEMTEFDKPCSSRGLLSTIMNRVELLQASMYSAGNPNIAQHSLALWQSAGGPGVGKFWTDIPGAGNLIDNMHFIVMTASRLDTITVIDGTQCQIRHAKPKTDGGPRVPRHMPGDRRCNGMLNNPLEHPYLCTIGSARLRPHDSMKLKLAAELIALHVYADIERHVPSMYKLNEKGNIEEAVLDIVVSYPGEAGMEAIDVTIRCPFHEAVQTPPGPAASACRDGAKAKSNKYGVRVFPLAFETFGRLNYDSVESLRQMAAKVARSNNGVTASGVGLATGPQVYAKLRRALEQTLLFEQADTILRSIGFIVSQTNNPNRTRAATPSRREVSFTPPTPVGLYLHQMGIVTAQPEPIDENGQAFTDIRTLSGLIESGEVADSPSDQYIPPTMADYIESTGSDVANNIIFNFMSQQPPQQNETG